MPQLEVALQEGFYRDAVAVAVNGREVFRNDGVTTRMQLGLARSFCTEVPEGSAHVAVDLPGRGIAGETDLEMTDALYVGVSVDQDGRVHFKTSTKPFIYA